jgi:hypothetical protein
VYAVWPSAEPLYVGTPTTAGVVVPVCVTIACKVEPSGSDHEIAVGRFGVTFADDMSSQQRTFAALPVAT